MYLLTLDDIAEHHGTDKSCIDHNYCPIYEKTFGHLRHHPVMLIELGVWQGASLKTWADYFIHPDRIIIGIDHNPDCWQSDRSGVYTYICDQTDTDIPAAKMQPDIIIDDASHISAKTIASFQAWFPLLKPGGHYIVEDIVTSYYYREDLASPHLSAMNYFKSLADCVNKYDVNLSGTAKLLWDVASLAFHPNMVIIEKGGAQ